MGFLTDNFLSGFFVQVIQFFHGFTGDYFLATLLFALAIRLLLLPLDIKSKRSTLKSQLAQPKINAIKQRYKNDPQKQSIALRELYKKEDIKMSAGCLPMLLQLPILFAMFGAIRVLSNTQSIQLVVGLAQGQSVLPESFLWIHNIWQPDAGHVAVMPSLAEFGTAVNASVGKISAESMQVAQSVLSHSSVRAFAAATDKLTDATLLGGMFSSAYQSIPVEMVSASAALNYETIIAPVMERFAGLNNGFYILPLATFATQWLVSREQTKQQQMMGTAGGSNLMMEWIMPVMIAMFAITTGSLFALYWTFGNLWSLGQTFIMNRVLKKKLQEEAEKSAKK